MDIKNLETFGSLIAASRPLAAATIRGGGLNTRLGGTVHFYPAGAGTLVVAEIFGLPGYISTEKGEQPAGPFYGFHIHSGSSCAGGTAGKPFPEAGTHFNPAGAPHPEHAGDLPPLMADKGYAYMAVYTSRFAPADVIGRVVIIHQNPDDFHTQPSGNAGTMIACGEIVKTPGTHRAD